MIDRIFKRPWIILTVITAITVFFIAQLPRIKIDNNYFNFIPKNQPSLIATKKLEKQFGSEDIIDLAVEAKEGSIISRQGIFLIRNLTKDISAVKNVEKVISISNSDFITGDSEGMEVIPLISDNFNGSTQQIDSIRERLLSWNLYRRNFISDDFSSTQIAVKLKDKVTQDDEKAVYHSIKNILSKYKDNEFNFYIAGMPSIIVLISQNVNRDLITLIPFVLFVVLFILFISFKKAGGVILPTLTVVISTIWTLGLMALLNIKLTIIGTIIPILLVAVGSAYGIHLINNYYDEMRKAKKDLTASRHREIVKDTVKHVGMPVLLAAVTTIAGFGSLAASKVVPMKNFGIFTAVGVAAAFIIAVTLIPALLLVRHNISKPDTKLKKPVKMTFFEKLLSAVHGFIQIRPDWLIMGFLIVVGFSIYGSMHLIKDNVMIGYFRPKSGIVKADNFLRRKFSGTNSFDIVVRGTRPGDLTDPEVLKFMDDLSTQLKKKFPQIGKIISFTDFIKLMNKSMNVPEAMDTESPNTGTAGSNNSQIVTLKDFASLLNKAYARAGNTNISTAKLIELINSELNYKGAAYYEIPYDISKYSVANREQLKNLISQYLLLFSGNISDWTDDAVEPTLARMQVLLLSKGTKNVPEIIEEINRFAKIRLPKGYSVETAGNAIVQHDLTNLIVNGAIRSFLISLLAVLIILSIYYKSFVAGLFSIIPIGLTILINFGVMGFFGIRMDIATAMVGSIAVGIGIDYTIHFLSAYKYERSKTNNLTVVSHNTLLTTGKAIIFNAASVGAGFAVLIFSSLMPLMYLGILITLTMVVSSLSALTIIPFMLKLFKPKFILTKKMHVDEPGVQTKNR
ncbi:MAG: RND family transporter [Spirochaetes bacterium]|nr:MAG: RND family transporter [Spirochaetota bacterium]